MLKRLIEVALPLKEISALSSREKRQLSAIHLWWARRPLPACRAVLFASLIPDPNDPSCPEEFRKLVGKVLSRKEFEPKRKDGSSIEDTPRTRCLEFIKHLAKWENSHKPEYIEPARTLIAAAHRILHPDSDSDIPRVLDPFAGGGAIPLEALRLACQTHAVDLNPVAHLIQLCTLLYPQKYGQRDSRPVADYINRLIAYNRQKKDGKSEKGLFDTTEVPVATKGELIPDAEITESDYRNNPLAADVKYWAQTVVQEAHNELARLYPDDHVDNTIAYLWVRTVRCSNPQCQSTIPLLRSIITVRGWLRRTPIVITTAEWFQNQFSIKSCRLDSD